MRGLLVIAGLALVFGAGCACCGQPEPAQLAVSRPEPAWHADLAAALLFDRRPGRYDASDFAIRGDWPSTVSFYSPGQVMFYQERFIDVQGRPFGGPAYTYHHVDSYRGGVGYR